MMSFLHISRRQREQVLSEMRALTFQSLPSKRAAFFSSFALCSSNHFFPLILYIPISSDFLCSDRKNTAMENSQLIRFLSENGVAFPMQSICSLSSSMDGSTVTPQDKALVALRNHKEAEKRRRQRINSHLDQLRSLLPCNSKTDKASLLAKVVQRVRELKEQTEKIPGLESFPSKTDEINVFAGDHPIDGQLIFKASLCCEDRSDLLPDIIEILKSLHLKTLKAEMVSLGGRMKNVLIVAAQKDQSIESIHFLQTALKSLIERSNAGERSKRRRTFDSKYYE